MFGWTSDINSLPINATKSGDFTWLCDIACDGSGNPNKPGSNKGWAMANKGYMMGTVHVQG